MSLTGLRERKKAKTKENLIAAAVELFSTRGFDATTVDDIAAAADVSPRTFFRYFATKDEVLFADAEDVRARFNALLEARPADEPLLVSLREVAVALLDDDEVEPSSAQLVMTLVNGHPALQARYLELLHEIEGDVARFAALRLGEQPHDLRPRLIAAAAMTARRVAFDVWVESGGHGEFTDVLLRALDSLFTGFDFDDD
jgi:AcrR family transcriptional regulator